MLQQYDLPVQSGSNSENNNYHQTCDTTNSSNPTSGCLSTPFSVKDILNIPTDDYFNSVKREQYHHNDLQPFWDNNPSYMTSEANYNNYNYYTNDVYNDLGYNHNFNNTTQIHFPHFSGIYPTEEPQHPVLSNDKEELYVKTESPSKNPVICVNFD